MSFTLPHKNSDHAPRTRSSRANRRARTSSPPSRLDTAALRAALLAWYRAAARDLPWRRTTDPYRVWLSEIMLQQTQVKTVLPYCERFVAAFPTVSALAAAPLERVLKLWEGLGYYARGRNLHRAAQLIMCKRGGTLPRDAEQWRELPGVGPYTANAIASITTGEPVAVLDGNVKRVLTRLLGVEQCIDEPRTIDTLWRAAGRLLDRASPGDFNQAMMELGARVCTPRAPACAACPVAPWCRALATGSADGLPVRRRRAKAPEFHEQAAIIARRGRYLLVRRPMTGLLAGLWGWPTVAVPAARASHCAIARAIGERFGLAITDAEEVAAVRHDFTHRRLWVHVYRAGRVTGAFTPADGIEARWATVSELAALPLSKLDRKIIAAHDERLRAPRDRRLS